MYKIGSIKYLEWDSNGTQQQRLGNRCHIVADQFYDWGECAPQFLAPSLGLSGLERIPHVYDDYNVRLHDFLPLLKSKWLCLASRPDYYN